MSFLIGLDCDCIRSDSSDMLMFDEVTLAGHDNGACRRLKKKKGVEKLKFSLALGGGGWILEVTHDHRSQRAKKFLKKAASKINQTVLKIVFV